MIPTQSVFFQLLWTHAQIYQDLKPWFTFLTGLSFCKSVASQDPLDSVEACKGPRGVITQYQTRFQSGSTVNTENVNIARCNAGRCSHTFEPPSNPPTSYDSVSVVAENVVGGGTCKNMYSTTHQ